MNPLLFSANLTNKKINNKMRRLILFLHITTAISLLPSPTHSSSPSLDYDQDYNDVSPSSSSPTHPHAPYQLLSTSTDATPLKPKSPDCFMYFPGSPSWRECFRKFTQDMADFQTQLHDFNRHKVQQQIQQQLQQQQQGNGPQFGPPPPYHPPISPQTLNSPPPPALPPPSSSYPPATSGTSAPTSPTTSTSTTTSHIGGYMIRAANLPVTTTLLNGLLTITIPHSYTENPDTKRRGNEINVSVRTKPTQHRPRKWVKIKVPKGVRSSDINVDRTPDAIYITAPAVITTPSKPSTSSIHNPETTSFPHHPQVSSYHEPPPPPTIPDFGNMFQNLFNNFFQYTPRSLPQQQQQSAPVRTKGMMQGMFGGGGGGGAAAVGYSYAPPIPPRNFRTRWASPPYYYNNNVYY